MKNNSFVMSILVLIILSLSLGVSKAEASGCDAATDIEFWKSIKNSQDPDEINAYLKTCPNGRFVHLARIRLKKAQSKPEKTEEKPVTKTEEATPKKQPVNPVTPVKRAVTPVIVPADEDDYRITKGKNVKLYSDPDVASPLKAVATIPRFVRVVSHLQGAGWKKVEYIRGKEAYIQSKDLHGKMDNPEADPNWLAYKNDEDGHWFIRIYQARIDAQKYRSLVNQTTGEFQRWAGIYLDSFAGGKNYYNSKACEQDIPLKEGKLLSSFAGDLRDIIFVWGQGNSLYLKEMGKKNLQRRTLTGEVYQMGSRRVTQWITSDHRKNRRFLKFRYFNSPNKNYNYWLNSYPFLSLVDNSLALAQKRPRGKESVFRGVYRCDQTYAMGLINKALRFNLRLALASQPGLQYHDISIYRPGKGGKSLDDETQWSVVSLKRATSWKLALPKDIEDHLYTVNNSRKVLIRISYLIPGSVCWTAGCRKNDIVVAINGKKISEFRPKEDPKAKDRNADILKALNELRKARKVKVSVWRNGNIHELNIERKSWYEQFVILLKKANKGDVEATFHIANIIGKKHMPFLHDVIDWPGNTVSTNAWDDQAIIWYRKAAEAGHVKAMTEYGWQLDRGNGGVPQNYKAAIKWYRLAIEKGQEPEAMENLARLYKSGNGFDQPSISDSIKWYKKAVERALVTEDNLVVDRSASALADFYYKGKYVPQDVKEAIKWYRHAANAGDEDSMVVLGDFYRDGKHLDRDYKEAAKWYYKATERGRFGDFKAATRLAGLYDKGLGFTKSAKDAARIVFNAVKKDYEYGKYKLDEFKKHIKGLSFAFRQEFQKLLKKDGVYKGGIDGAFGKGTYDAVVALSKK